MTDIGLGRICSIIVSWLGNLHLPVINVTALTVWVGIFLMAMGVWIVGNVYGIAMDFYHDAKADEKARAADAERERSYYENKAESAKLRLNTDDLSNHERNVIQYNYWLHRSRGGSKW